MLVDDFIAQMDEHDRNGLAPPGGAGEAQRALRLAQRFVLGPLAKRTCEDMADPEKIERSRDYIFAPASTTWLEWRGSTAGFYAGSDRHGLLIDGRGGDGHSAILTGSLSYVFDTWVDGRRMPISASFIHDLQADDREIITWSEVTRTAARYEPWKSILESLDIRAMGAFLGATFALIATPRISDLTLHDHAKVNRSRLAKGFPPLLSWREVSINIDDISPKTPHQTDGEGVSLHHVRSHLRIKLGKVEMVRPHWRGDPRIGVVLHRHRVVRAEDEGGEWSGGVLPAPVIIGDMARPDDDD